MKQCYICGMFLKTKEQDFDSKTDTLTHKEHIIQNALRGKVISESILCSKCGNDLNAEIDANFIKYFAPITELLDKFIIEKDHGKNNAKPAIIGQLLSGDFEGINANYKDGVVSADKPAHFINWDTKEVTIIANKKIIAAYESKVLKEIAEKSESPDVFNINKITEFNDIPFLPYFGEGILDINETLHKGFIKIATEFALSKGIQRNELNRVIEIDERSHGKLLFDRNLITYFPQGAIDRIFEFYRPLLEPNYPTHSLILFTHERRNNGYVLYCYIDLFSTFQVFVILNNNYPSPLYESHYQPVLKDELLSENKTKSLQDTLRDIHKRFERITDSDEELDEIDANIAKGIKSLPEDLSETLEGEIEGIDNIIINQNMDKADFTDMSTYDLTVGYKRYFYNNLSDECENLPIFLIKASKYANDTLVNYVHNYYSAKVAKLLETIEILKIVNDDT